MQPKDRIIVAVDVPELGPAVQIVRRLHNKVGYFKFGFELLSRYGIEKVLEAITPCSPSQMFVDLKLNDIPNTVAAAARQISSCGVGMFNVHASAGPIALQVAAENRETSLVLAVTVLTSFDEGTCSRVFNMNPNTAVQTFARMAREAGLQGVISSPKELPLFEKISGFDGMLKVTPGVRPTWAAANDQKRVMTPGEAIRAGATHLVIGRPITQPPESVGTMEEAVALITQEIFEATTEVTTT